MTRRKAYLFTIGFLILSTITFVILAILSEQLPFKKYIDPLGHFVTISPGLIALIFIGLNKRDKFSLLAFRKFDVWILLELIGVYLFVCVIEIFIQIKLGNISFLEIIPRKEIFGHSVNPIIFISISSIYFLGYAGLGEEIAWRGYLLSKLKRLSYIEITLLINIVWALWHLPVFLFDSGNNGIFIYRFGTFLFMAIEFGIFLNYCRIRTNSVWGAIILHPFTNIFSYFLSAYFVINDSFWGKHPNLIVVMCLLPFAIYYFIRGRKYYQSFQKQLT